MKQADDVSRACEDFNTSDLLKTFEPTNVHESLAYNGMRDSFNERNSASLLEIENKAKNCPVRR
jgi:hypothetical protein